MTSSDRRPALRRWILSLGLATLVAVLGCQSNAPRTTATATVGNSDDLLVVDCLLPGQVRKLGQSMTFIAPRRAVKTTGTDCEIRGGEYVAFDRADYATALKIWLPAAQGGDSDAQVYVGEIYEKGLGLEADYILAQAWYRKAAAQGNTRALINLGYLYESGLGVQRDLAQAMNWYRKASGLSEGNLEYVSSVEQANRKAVKNELTGLRREVTQLRSDLGNAQKKLSDSRRSLANKERQAATLRRNLGQTGQTGLATAAVAVPTKGTSAAPALAQKLENAQQDRRRLLAQLAGTQADSEKLRAELTGNQAELEEKKQHLQTALQALEKTRRQLVAAQSDSRIAAAPDTRQLESQFDQTNQNLTRDRRELTRLTRQLADAQLQKSQLIGNLKARDAEYAKAQIQMAKLLEGRDEYEETRVLLAESQQERLRLTGELAKVQVETAQLRQRVPRIEQELMARQRELKANQATIDQLRQNMARYKTADGSLDREVKILETALDEKQALLASTQRQLSALEEQLRIQKRTSTQAIAAAQAREEAVSNAVLVREQRIRELEEKLAPALRQTAELQSAREQLQEADTERLRLANQLAQQQIASAKLQEERIAAEMLVETQDRELAQNQETLTLLQDQLAQRDANLASSSKKVAALQDELQQRTRQFEDQRVAVSSLEADHKREIAKFERQTSKARQDQSDLNKSVAEQQATIQRLETQLLTTQVSLVASERKSSQLGEVEKQLESERSKVSDRENEIQRLLTKISAAEQAMHGPKTTAVVTTTTEGPTIEIIEPPLAVTRGAPSILLRSPSKAVEVVGRVSPENELLSFKINEDAKRLEANGIFHEFVAMRSDRTPVNVVAVDKQGNRTTLDFYIVPPSRKTGGSAPEPQPKGGPSKRATNIDFGTYHALIIGNQSYSHLPNLETPENDARELDALLRKKYGFQTTLLLDATRYQMLSALNDLRARLTEKDNLVIFYAGHGELDDVNLRGHWLPVDAEPDSSANWISNVAITDVLNAMAAKHVLVIADSCYSGAMTRSSLARLENGMSSNKKNEWYKIMAGARARAVLSSGGLEPVLDSGGGDHSIFTAALIDILRKNDGILEGYSLYRELQSRVKTQAAQLNVNQDPQYAPIKFAGHEAGEFFFLPQRTMFGSIDTADEARISSL